MTSKKIFFKRIIMSLAGVIMLAISVGFMRVASFGVDPFTTVITGSDKVIPLAYGIVYIIINVLLLVFSLVFNRHLIGIATFINLFLLGYMTQFTYSILYKITPEPAIWLRIIYFIVAILILCYGSAMYITADLGVSTYDAIAITIANKWHFWKFKFVRISTDLLCIIIGTGLYLLGGGKISEVPTFLGPGTVIIALFMGPLIDFFKVHSTDKILYGKQEETNNQ